MQSIESTATAVVVGIVIASAITAGLATATGTPSGNDRTIGVDERTRIDVTVPEASAGVQRYNVTVRAPDPSVASLESAAAGDVGAFQIRSRTADAVTFRAADLSRSVRPGATNVSLAAITVVGTGPGASTLRVTVHDFRTDEGERVTPAVRAGTVAVRGADAVPTARPSSGPPVGGRSAGRSALTVLWAASGSAIVLAVLAVAYRRRRTESIDPEGP